MEQSQWNQGGNDFVAYLVPKWPARASEKKFYTREGSVRLHLFKTFYRQSVGSRRKKTIDYET